MSTSVIRTRRATLDDLEALTPLFDAYRQFYRFKADLPGARQFLAERLRREDSAIFLALHGEHLAGFAQLYPSFSSGAMARIFVLNDLFVTPESRRRGIGFSLLAAAAEYARAEGAVRLALSTELTNTAARQLTRRQDGSETPSSVFTSWCSGKNSRFFSGLELPPAFSGSAFGWRLYRGWGSVGDSGAARGSRLVDGRAAAGRRCG